MPFVSVIVPVFNRFQEADRAIRSVLAQTWTNWELIVVDDSSREQYVLPGTCGNYTQNIVLLRNEVNCGPGLSRQRGMDLARGEYICFLDSDDYYHPDFLARSLSVHRNNPGIAATYTIAKYVQTDAIREGSDLQHHCIMPTLFTHTRPWPTCGLLWDRSAVGRWKNLRTNQDSLFELDCSFINNRLVHVPEVLCFIDKGTGRNTTDLVGERDWNRDRNEVVRYALLNWKRIQIIGTSCANLMPAIVSRLLFVSSKLAQHGDARLIWANGLLVLRYKPFAGLSLILMAPWVILRSQWIRLQVKKILEKFSLCYKA